MNGKLRVLVTGASGFVGGALARHLRGQGHDVVGTVSSRPGAPEDVRVDIRDRRAFDALPGGTFDVVVHAAALIGPERFDRRTREVNIDGTRHALDFAREREVRHFVQVSSIAAYGLRCVGEARDERTALSTSRFHPFETEYMRSKATAERLVARSGLPYTTLRLPVVVGAGSSFAAPAILGHLHARIAPYVKRRDARVSVVCEGNLGPMLDAVLAEGPAQRAFNACDHHLAWNELVEQYASALGMPVPWTKRPPTDFVLRASDPYAMFWLSNGLLGAHFPSDAFEASRPWTPRQTLEQAVRDEVNAYVGSPGV
jgi:nucleoside-diphosphate-sugar epimerase